MIAKLLAAALLVAAPVPASDDVLFIDYPAVRQVRCDEGLGTAVQTQSGWLSVAHVTAMHGCRIDGQSLTMIEQNGGLDFSRFVVSSRRKAPVPIDCRGFVPGEFYWSTGYAYGLPFQTVVRLRATGFVSEFSGQQILFGEHTVIPGMSGGMVFSSAGIVGMVNAYNAFYGLSFSRPLSQTSVCSKS